MGHSLAIGWMTCIIAVTAKYRSPTLSGKKKGRGNGKCSKSVDCAVFVRFPPLPPLSLLLPLTCGRRNGRDADGSTWTGPKRRSLPQASLDERRSGTAGLDSSHAVEPFLFLVARGDNWRNCHLAFS